MNMSDTPTSSFRSAHRHSANNRQEILRSGTALCPHCGVDSVIGSAAGFPLTDEFLKAMHQEWFDKTIQSK